MTRPGSDRDRAACLIEHDGACLVRTQQDLASIFKKSGDSKLHYIHPYPAKFIPAIPRFLIENFTNPGDVVLDPFCGSGTTALEAMLAGRKAACTDIMPLPVLVSKVKTTPVDVDSINRARERLMEGIKRDLQGNATVPEPSFPNVDFWFTPKVKRQLSIIKKNIDGLENGDVKDFFTVSFSGIVKKASKTYPGDILLRLDKNYVERDAIEMFDEKVDRNIKAIGDLPPGSSATVKAASADKLPFGDGSIDAIITDPPYSPWSIRYVEAMKNEMYWDGLIDDHLVTKKDNWGENNLGESCSKKDTGIRSIRDMFDIMDGTDRDFKKCQQFNFALNMERAFKEFHRVVKPGGRFIIRVGNPKSKIDGEWRELRNDEMFEEIGKAAGFDLDGKFDATYGGGALPSTRHASGKSMRRDHYFIFKRA